MDFKELERMQRKFYDAKYKSWMREDSCYFFHLDLAKKIISSLEVEEGDLILDCGCGNGWFTRIVSAISGCMVVGIDFSREGVHFAKEIGGHFVVGDVNFLPFKKGVFDGAYSNSVLYLIKHPNLVLKDLHRVIKSNSNLVTFDPRNSLLRKILVDPIARKVGGPGRRYFDEGEMRELIQSSPLRLQSIEIWYIFASLIKPIAVRIPFKFPSIISNFLIYIDNKLTKYRRFSKLGLSISTISKKH